MFKATAFVSRGVGASKNGGEAANFASLKKSYLAKPLAAGSLLIHTKSESLWLEKVYFNCRMSQGSPHLLRVLY